MVYQIFLSRQVKWWEIITYKHGIYELPNELSSLPAKMKVLVTLAENPWKEEIKLFCVVCYFIWKLQLVSNILSPETVFWF